MAQRPNHLYEFGPYRLDPGERQLLHDGQPLSLPPKLFETLLALVENAGHALEKDELLRRVWGDTFVEEVTLAKNISLLRRALGEGENEQRYIETISKFGYRFVAPVERKEAPPRMAVKGLPAIRAQGMIAVPVLALIVAVYFFVPSWLPITKTVEAPTLPPRVKVVVLPFANLSASAEEDYFADGLTEEMIMQLARLSPERLAVIARTSAMHFKGSKKTVAEIGKELGVDYVLEGSLRREGDKLRVTAQLIQVRDQMHRWARNYERSLHDLVAVQEDVARAIASEIRVQLTPPGLAAAGRRSGALPVSPEVHHLYLKGRFFWNKRTEAGYVKAIDFFQQTIRQDPEFAAAHAGLADTYALLGSVTNSTISRLEAMPRARAFAEKALALDESLAEAHTSLAFVKMHFEQDWAGAEKEFQRAIELNPSYVTAHHWYAYCLLAQTRFEEALREIRLALELDPLSLIVNTDVAEVLYFARQYDEAIQQAQKTLEMDPSFALAHRVLGLSYEQKGMYPESIAAFRALIRLSGRADHALAALGRSYALSGNRREAEKLLAELLALKPANSGALLGPAIVHAALGNKEQAISWLEKLAEQRAGIVLIKVEPYFDSLRSEPRFRAIERRLRLSAE
jgi:TolB-like protein/DNA-binding winged helix-turn-helix (wHTH) protein/tetratricopeptide (TPR) repeat protein